MAQYTNITALPIYGGQDINRQFRALKRTLKSSLPLQAD